MFKSDLVSAVANRTLKKDADVKVIVDAALDVIREQLAAGDTITLQGFGTFQVRTRAARTSRNPQTGEPVQVSEKKAPGFKPAKALKDALN